MTFTWQQSPFSVDDHETEYEYEGSDGEEAEVAEGEPR